MKFAKVLEQTLVQQDIPESWIAAAIQYKALKKCINRVVDELNLLGLEKNTLKLLLDDKPVDVGVDSHANHNPIIAQYVIKKSSSAIQPKLKVTIDRNTSFTDDHMDSLIIDLKQKIENIFYNDNSDEDKVIEIKGNEMVVSPTTSAKIHADKIEDDDAITKDDHKYVITIKLNSDSKFFQMLESELSNLDAFKQREETAIIQQVEAISTIIDQMSHRESLKKSDLYKWRELFRIYLDSEVYFKYNQVDVPSSALTAEKVQVNLKAFVDRVDKSGIVSTFKNKASRQTFDEFIGINYQLLKVLQFQSINTEAFRKILKKFDKQTSLGIKHTFPKLISDDHIFMSGSSIAQSICYIIQDSVIGIIPQLDDYTCPVCLSIAYKPIRLECGHLFCVRCLVKMKQEHKLDCPLCRFEQAVLKATGANLDVDTMALMERYFPKEVKEKLRERSKEKYEETVGNGKCIIT